MHVRATSWQDWVACSRHEARLVEGGPPTMAANFQVKVHNGCAPKPSALSTPPCALTQAFEKRLVRSRCIAACRPCSRLERKRRTQTWAVRPSARSTPQRRHAPPLRLHRLGQRRHDQPRRALLTRMRHVPKLRLRRKLVLMLRLTPRRRVPSLRTALRDRARLRVRGHMPRVDRRHDPSRAVAPPLRRSLREATALQPLRRMGAGCP